MWVWVTAASAQTYPDYTELWVNDYADLMTAQEEDQVRVKLQELQDVRGIEFTVLTIPSMSEYGHSGEIEPFATGLFNQWGIGDATRNDGVLMLVARFDRVMRIEVGSGYGNTKNDAMAAIIDDVMFPHFRSDDYAKGIDRGVDAVVKNLTGIYPGEFDLSSTHRIWNRLNRWLDRIGDWIFIAYAFGAGLVYRFYRRWRRNRPRVCPVDGQKMQRHSEDNDDKYLQGGQRAEERLKSVDYDVWHCVQCDHITIEAYKVLFSKYGACRSCNFKTLEGDSTLVTPASTSSTGLRRVDFHCQHCDDRYHTHEVIPKLSKSSSSASGGGSFGGGSSSGGGASGSW
ncbi:MAG: TPM domain-containing protein [Cognatishimia sp.]